MEVNYNLAKDLSPPANAVNLDGQGVPWTIKLITFLKGSRLQKVPLTSVFSLS